MPEQEKKNLYDDLVNKSPLSYEESVAQTQNPNGIGTSEKDADGNEIMRDATAADAKLNTGSGAEAAIGTQYSWEKQGADKAQKQYESDVLAQKDKLLTQAQQTANNAVNYQTQADMMKYQNNQNAEKVGWTGGYVLDQNRQMDYLKASIQAQMYGAMELQKYGYDSALAAARLSYDLNQQEYARQYYNDAVSAALSEAQLTGTYFSAETKDMMSQYSIASQKLDEPNLSDEEKTKAQSILKTIEDWFTTNGISPAGVKTMAAYQYEADQAFQWNSELYTRYQAAVQTLKEDQQNNPTIFFELDKNGNPIFDGMDVQTIDFKSLGINEAVAYAKNSDQAKQQLYSYFNWIINDAIAKYKESVMSKDANGNIIYNINKDNFKAAITEAINQVKQYQDSDSEHKLNDFNFVQTDSTTSVTYTPKTDAEGNQVYDSNGNPVYEINVDANNNGNNSVYDGTYYRKLTTYTLQQLFDNYNTPNGTSFSISSTAMRSDYGVHGSINSWTDDDMEINLYSDGTRKKNYDCDIDWSAGQSRSNNKFGSYTTEGAKLIEYYPNPTEGEIIYYNGKLWICHILTDSEGKSTWCFGYITKNAGGNKLYDDFNVYIDGKTPDRWN